MHTILVASILVVGAIFLLLTVLIAGSKAWREARDAWRRRRRRELEPKVLSYAHGEDPSILPFLGTEVRGRDRHVLERIIHDHMQRVRGIEAERLGRALDELGYVDEYLEKLVGRHWWTRAEAAEKLGISGAERAVEQLARAMEDPVYEVRLRAARALGALGGAIAIRPLVGALGEPNRWSTIRIADILTDMGPEVVEELIDAFPEMGLTAKLATLDILGRIKSTRAAVWLRVRLKDFEPDVRARACHALGAVGDPDAGTALVEALADPEWPARAMAARALGRIRNTEALPELCEALKDREWWVRANAAEALRQTGPEGLSSLWRMLDDEDAFARDQAVLMLQESGVLDEEVTRLADADPALSAAARAVVDRVVRVGQLGRLRELARAHADSRVRGILREMLPEEAAVPVDEAPR